MTGDTLARGGKTAQFSTGGSAVNDPVILHNVAPEAETLGSGITVIDKRPNWLAPVASKEVLVTPKKFAEKKFSSFTPILDRILVKRCAEGPDMKIMEDGSVLNTKTGLLIAGKYRQHSNIGIVLATGQFVILGGQRIAMSEVVRVGDRVTFGEYNAEVFLMDEKKVQELCDAVQMNYEADPEGLRVVRVQDVRGIEREMSHTEEMIDFYNGPMESETLHITVEQESGDVVQDILPGKREEGFAELRSKLGIPNV